MNLEETNEVSFYQWKFIFWAIVKDNNIYLLAKDEYLKELYDDNLSPEDAINVITLLHKNNNQ